MRIGKRLGGSVFWGLAVTIGLTAGARAGERAKTVPLGGGLAKQEGGHYYGVYVPTRFGGELTLTTTSGRIIEIQGPNGTSLANGQDVGTDHQGWYTFRVDGAKGAYTVGSKFIQTAQSARKPWNYYYWPTKADSIHEPWAGGNGRVDTTLSQIRGDDELIARTGDYIRPGQDIVLAGPNGLLETFPAPGDTATWFPNLYDDLTWTGPDQETHSSISTFQTPSPLLKYDQIFHSSARQWEASFSQTKGISRWPGHCLGGAVASIQLNEPVPAPGSGLTRDELKALWAELGENHLNHQIGDYANDIPAGPPRPGPDVTDSKAPRVHAMLEAHIRGRRQALLSNLRAFPPRGTPNEVWNHGVYKYVATYHALTGRGPRAVRIEVELHANTGSMLNGQDDHDRVVRFVYNLVYGLDGRVDETNLQAADWISVGGEAMFAPLNILELSASHWGGHNPYVTEANVRSLDVSNGGSSFGRLAQRPPTFRRVGEYEANRSPMIASQVPMEAPASESETGGGGFLRRIFFGRGR